MHTIVECSLLISPKSVEWNCGRCFDLLPMWRWLKLRGFVKWRPSEMITLFVHVGVDGGLDAEAQKIQIVLYLQLSWHLHRCCYSFIWRPSGLMHATVSRSSDDSDPRCGVMWVASVGNDVLSIRITRAGNKQHESSASLTDHSAGSI